MGQLVLGDADPFVAHLQHHRIAVPIVAGGQKDSLVPAGQSLAGIQDQVDHYLFDALGVALDPRQVIGVAGNKALRCVSDRGVHQAHRRLGHGVEFHRAGKIGIVAPGEVLEVFDDPLDAPGAVEGFGKHLGDLTAHPRIIEPAKLEIPLFPIMGIQDRIGVKIGFFQQRQIEQDQSVGVVDLVGHPGNQNPQRSHLVGLDELALTNLELFDHPLAFGDLLFELAGAQCHLLLEGARPDHCPPQPKQQRGRDHGNILGNAAPGDPPGLENTKPFVVDLPVAAGFFQDCQPFAEAGQQLSVALFDRISVGLLGDRPGGGPDVVKPPLPDQVFARQLGHQGAVVASRGQQLQGFGEGIGEHQGRLEVLLEHEVMHDAPLHDDDFLAAQIFDRFGLGLALAGPDGLVDDGMRRRIVDLLDPVFRVGHPLQNVNPAGRQGLAHRRPVAEADLHVHPHDLGDGPAQFDVVAGRPAIFVEIFIRRIVVIAADHDGRFGVRIIRARLTHRRRRQQRSPEKGQDQPAGSNGQRGRGIMKIDRTTSFRHGGSRVKGRGPGAPRLLNFLIFWIFNPGAGVVNRHPR